jgi:hypothetical protein
MPLAQLIAVPVTPLDLQAWQFANVASHRDIIRRVQETQGIELTEYPLEPFDPKDPASLGAFLNAHQSMHTDFDRVLGLNSYDLSEVDWQDPANLAQWMQAHFVEHEAASALLGVS